MAKLPFGKETRNKIMRRHLRERAELTPEIAWQFIYEELLWIDISTGLAHLYESDKAQPGRNWYNRTVRFTNLLCEKFGGITRIELKSRVDGLFRAIIVDMQGDDKINQDDATKALTDLQVADQVIEQIVETAESVLQNETTKISTDEDLIAEFAQIILERTNLQRSQAEQLASTLAKRARLYYTLGNKRQNVLGEGFEDILRLLLIEVAQVSTHQIVMRTRANTLPGFKVRSNRKREEAPDMAIIADSTHLSIVFR